MGVFKVSFVSFINDDIFFKKLLNNFSKIEKVNIDFVETKSKKKKIVFVSLTNEFYLKKIQKNKNDILVLVDF
ncbi:MAG: hypothetical protein ACMXX8_02365 [Candidatus Woesearchaeota archaeon]